MKKVLEDWITLAKQTKAAMEQAKEGFEELSSRYVDIRAEAFNDDAAKEEIDTQYRQLSEVHEQLKGLQAGGGRRRRHRTRKHKGRK